MTRTDAKDLMPIIQAFAEGKTIQRINSLGEWSDVTGDVLFNCNPEDYRIKPEPYYRPFKNQEECWNEMHKHPDFGWIKSNVTGECKQIVRIYNYKTELVFNIFSMSLNNCACYSPETIFINYTFTDDTPFGIKE